MSATLLPDFQPGRLTTFWSAAASALLLPIW
jgi:hypothetical protein